MEMTSMKTMNTPMTRRTLALLMIAAAACSMTAASAWAETDASNDVGSAAVSDVAPAPSNFWSGSLPTGSFSGASTDTVLPLPLTISPNALISADTALTFISVEVRPKLSPEAAPLPGSLTYHATLGLVLWDADAPLDPLTTYTVSVLVDNEALDAQSLNPQPNLTADFEITTADGILTATEVALNAELVTYRVTSATAPCPDGEVICQSSNPQTLCVTGVDYERTVADLSVTWSDGEAGGEELFFYHALSVPALELQLFPNAASTEQALQSQHDAAPVIVTPVAEACFELKSTDLRSAARGDAAAGTLTVTRCVALDMPATPDLSAELAACEPSTQPVTDTSGGSSGGDTSSSSNTSGNNDDGGCSTTHTRSQTQNPAGLLLSLVAAFGAALTLRRRKALATR
jgi:uncharacterized protein (TIGR03382 family)